MGKVAAGDVFLTFSLFFGLLVAPFEGILAPFRLRNEVENRSKQSRKNISANVACMPSFWGVFRLLGRPQKGYFFDLQMGILYKSEKTEKRDKSENIEFHWGILYKSDMRKRHTKKH